MKNIQAKCNSVFSAFLRQHPSPSVLNLEPKCAPDKFSICGNGCVGVQRLASWRDCQKLGNTENLLLLHTRRDWKKKKTEPKDPSVGTPDVALQNIIPLQEPLLSSLYLRVNPQNYPFLTQEEGSFISPKTCLGKLLYFPKTLTIIF